ncbi:hypothetical protein, partial [Succinatimonas hippei]|uniref:hypothetical protein n=1 Tax=Succinatimonas hippei TaxID=626938 RepID=UPI00249058D0
ESAAILHKISGDPGYELKNHVQLFVRIPTSLIFKSSLHAAFRTHSTNNFSAPSSYTSSK